VVVFKKIVVVEVTETQLLFVSVRKGLRHYQINAWATIDGFKQRDPLSLGPEIADFYRRAGVDKAQTVVVLPRSSVVLRLMQFPKAVLDNLASIIDYQVENYEPIDRAELAYAYQLVDRRPTNGKLEVLLAMARRVEVAQLQKSLAALGVRPRAIVCGSLGLARLLRKDSAKGVHESNLLLHVGADEFEVMGFLNGKLHFTKRFDLASHSSRSEQWAQELARARAALRLEEKDLHNVFVSGNELESVLKELRPLVPGLPLHPLRVPLSLGSRMKPAEFQRFAPAIGIAMEALTKSGVGTNLMEQGEVVTRPRWVWIPTYVLCGAALVMGGAGGIVPYIQQGRFLKQLSAEIVRLQPQLRQVEKLETQANEFQQKVAVLETLRQRDAMNLEVLRELTEILPDSVWVNELNFRGDSVDISGFADNATALVPILERSPLFKEVALTSGIIRNQGGKDLFRLRARIRF
jgi:Tfp pilus assembly protein PilN